MLIFFRTGGVVDISERVEFCYHDIEVVATDAMRLNGNALSLIVAGNGMKLSAAYLTFYFFKVLGYGIHPGGVANEDYLVGQLFGLEMQMEATSVGINDEF